MIESLLTAAEMARKLDLSLKTFNRRVRQYRVPFIAGRVRLFDPSKVLRALETTVGEKTSDEVAAPNGKPRRRSNVLPPGANDKYRILLGL